MDVELKQCPLCAEGVARTATVCPYCGAKFAVNSNGYCTACHAVRVADETGLCKTCGNPVADWRLESQLIEEPAPRSTPTAPSPITAPLGAVAQPAITKAPSPSRLYAILGGILLLLVITASAWLGRSRIPLVANLLFTPTSSITPTSPPTHTPTPLPTYTPTLTPSPTVYSTPTPTPFPAWVADFAEPLLAEVANHPPDIDEDFPGKWSRYLWTKSPSVSFSDGALHMTATDSGANAVTAKMADGQDFILQFDLTPEEIDPIGGANVLFRSHSEGNTDIYCWLAFRDSWWDIACENRSGDRQIAAGKTSRGITDRTTTVTLIVSGDEIALYLDGRPVGYGQDEDHLTGSGPHFDVYAPQGTTTVDIDNVKFWDLNNLKPEE